MKRTEFIRDVTTWWELMDVCEEHSLRTCEDIIDDESRNDYINETLVDLARNNSWQDLRDTLNCYADDDGYDFYAYDDYYGRWRPLDDDDFDNYKDLVLEEMDNNDYFDPEDDEEDSEEPSAGSGWKMDSDQSTNTEDDFEFVDEEECSMIDMMAAGAGCIRELDFRAKELEREENAAFELDDLFF